MQALSARMAQELLEEPITEADWIIEDLFPWERIYWLALPRSASHGWCLLWGLQ